MIYLILIVVAICVVIWLISEIWELIKLVLGVALIILGIVLYFCFFQITIPLTCLYIGYRVIRYLYRKLCKYYNKRKDIRENKKILFDKNYTVSDKRINNIINSKLAILLKNDMNDDDRKFIGEKIPWGRVEAFLNYFKTSTDNENAYYFSAIPSIDDSEIREYGMVLTDKGLYFSIQNNDSVDNEFISYAGLKKVEVCEEKIKFYVINSNDYTTKCIIVKRNKMFVDYFKLRELCNEFISEGISNGLFRYTYSDGQLDSRSIEKNLHFDSQSAERGGSIATMGAQNSLYQER